MPHDCGLRSLEAQDIINLNKLYQFAEAYYTGMEQRYERFFTDRDRELPLLFFRLFAQEVRQVADLARTLRLYQQELKAAYLPPFSVATMAFSLILLLITFVSGVVLPLV